MNQKGFPGIIIVGGIIAVVGVIAIAAWFLSLGNPAPGPSTIETFCNGLEAKYPGQPWEEICIDPSNQALKDSLAQYDMNLDSIPSGKLSVVKVTCSKIDGAWQTPTGEIKQACEKWQTCEKPETSQTAGCVGSPCNNNLICDNDAGETAQNCPIDCEM